MNKSFIGTKTLLAMPCTRGEYNDHRGWSLPPDENGEDAGYLVTYPDGYVSWSPKPQFDEAYQTIDAMNFGHALHLIKEGCKLSRAGWNGKGMFIFLVPGSQFIVNRPPLLGIYPEGTEVSYHAHIDMKTADGQIVPWLCSQTDMLANDWGVVA